MTELSWCLKQAKGIKLVEPSDVVSKDYVERAEADLDAMNSNTGHWKVITGYYACYDILYALLMKVGIKSEIHDCSIAAMSLFDFTDSDISFISSLKKDRVDVQYYLKEASVDADAVKRFVLNVKEKLSVVDVAVVRNRFEGLL